MPISLETVRRRMRDDAYSPVPQRELSANATGLSSYPTASKTTTPVDSLGGPGPRNPIDYNSTGYKAPTGPTLGGPGPQNPVDYNSTGYKAPTGPTLGGPGPQNPVDYNSTPPMSTGYPPTPVAPTPPPMSTGYPPIAGTPTPPMSTGYPPTQAPQPGPVPGVPMSAGNSVVNAQVNPQELTSVNLQQLLAANSPYIRAAERAGQRTAASRGLLNSSMAAGAARRSAIEAGAPIAESDAQAYRSAANTTRDFLYRDALAGNDAQRANWLNSNSTEREFRYRDSLANNDTQRQDWLASNAYNRDFTGRLSMMPIASSFDFFNSAMQAALEDPSVYPPEVVNSLSQFNMQQLNQILAGYLGNGG